MWSGGWQVSLFHLSCPNIFRVGRTECCPGVVKALSQVARHVLLGRVDESRRGRAQYRIYRCLGLAQHFSQAQVRVPILCAAPGASSSCFSVKCGTFEPEGSGWGAASSVVPFYCSGLTQQACSVNQLSGAGGLQRVR
jgi:hypothetical protein